MARRFAQHENFYRVNCCQVRKAGTSSTSTVTTRASTTPWQPWLHLDRRHVRAGWRPAALRRE